MLYYSNPHINLYIFAIRLIFILYGLKYNISDGYTHHLSDSESSDVNSSQVGHPSSSRAVQPSSPQTINRPAYPLYQEKLYDVFYDHSSFLTDRPANTQFYTSKLLDNTENISEMVRGTNIDIEISHKNAYNLAPAGPNDLVSQTQDFKEIIIIRNAGSLPLNEQRVLLENVKQGLFNVNNADHEALLAAQGYQTGSYYDEKRLELRITRRAIASQNEEGYDSGIETERRSPPRGFQPPMHPREHENDLRALEARKAEFFRICKRK
jgi:hypothetical protein